MTLRIDKTGLPGVLLIEPRVFMDDRGFFMETYHYRKYADRGIDVHFVQDNHSHSRQNTLRGLHYQLNHAQGKLIYVVKGDIFDIALDIRKGSPTFGEWTGARLSEENRKQIYVPEGFAHGFCVLSKQADVIYKCTDLYYPDDEYGINWADNDIGIEWPVKDPVLSDKDNKYPMLKDIPEELLPIFEKV
jgi:dTDP-4-dehydrorhamnose 3,5-epimerase